MAAVTDYHKFNSLKTTHMYYLTVLQGKSWHGLGWFLCSGCYLSETSLGSLWKNPFAGSFRLLVESSSLHCGTKSASLLAVRPSNSMDKSFSCVECPEGPLLLYFSVSSQSKFCPVKGSFHSGGPNLDNPGYTPYVKTRHLNYTCKVFFAMQHNIFIGSRDCDIDIFGGPFGLPQRIVPISGMFKCEQKMLLRIDEILSLAQEQRCY